MDELAINPSANFHSKSNSIIGFCSNHTPNISTMKFQCWDDFLEIKDSYAKGEIHLAKEALFFTIGITFYLFIF